MKKIIIAFVIILSCTSCSKLFKNKISEDVLIEQALNAIESNDTVTKHKLGVDEYPKFNFGKYKIIKSYNCGNFHKKVTTQFENGDTCLWELNLMDGKIMNTYGLSNRPFSYYKNKHNIQIKYTPVCPSMSGTNWCNDDCNFMDLKDAINYAKPVRRFFQAVNSKDYETIQKLAPFLASSLNSAIENGEINSNFSTNETIEFNSSDFMKDKLISMYVGDVKILILSDSTVAYTYNLFSGEQGLYYGKYHQKVNTRLYDLGSQRDDTKPSEIAIIYDQIYNAMLGILAFGLILTLILLIWNSKYTSQHNS